MAGATVLSVGGVSISAGSGQTGDLLQKVVDATSSIPSSDVVVVGPTDTSLPSPPTGAGPFELVIPASYTGTLSIPAGYTYVVYAGSGELTGGDPSTVIVGTNLDYSGGAGTVLGTGSGSVSDSISGAMLSFSSIPGSTVPSSYDATVTGANAKVDYDSSTGGTVEATGSGDSVVTGTPSGSGSGSALSAAIGGSTLPVTEVILKPSVAGAAASLDVNAGSNDLVFVYTSSEITATGGDATVVLAPSDSADSGGVVTLNATGGTQDIFDATGGNVINAGPNTAFIGATGAAESTYNSMTGGADTIFSLASIDYTGGNAASLFFLAGTQAVTVAAATSETVFGGSGGGAYSIGSSGFSFDAGALGTGGADTLTGAVGSGSIAVFGASGENLTINQASTTSGNTFITYGEAETINATGAAGGNTFISVNEALTGGGTFTGNTTLIGSSAGNDLFSIFIDNTSPPAHTITIENYQSTDKLFIGDLSNAGEDLNATDTSAIAAFEAGGSSSLTLSDGTKIDFTGLTPTTILHS